MDSLTDDFATTGAVRLRGALASSMDELERCLSSQPADNAGVRLHGIRPLQEMLAADGCVGIHPASLLGQSARPVRAVLFNKTPETNWSLAWHQDRTICVKARQEVAGFGPWTVKQGLIHVAPPVELLARMVTIRVHLDDVHPANAPLLIAPGSHLAGMVPVQDISEIVERCGTAVCLAEAGDVWMYATLILHASEAAREPESRRVLQVDYAAFDLPGGLEWQGV